MRLDRRVMFGVLLMGCSDGPTSAKDEPPVSRILVIDRDLQSGALHLGDSVVVRAVRLDRDGDPIAPDTVSFYWSSTDTTVFTVDQTGKIKAVGFGSADVVARVNLPGREGPSASDTGSGKAPVRVSYTIIDAGPIVAAALAYEHQCIVRLGGAAFCRGLNTFGQLGNGTTTNSTEWVPVIGGHTFSSISAGKYHTCGLTPDNHAFCWGRNHYGQLGMGIPTFSSNPTPSEVTGSHRWSSLDAGGHGQTCGTDAADNLAYCFGHNDAGQTGDVIVNPFRDTLVAPISGAHHMSAIFTEHFYSCGLETDGGVFCWGFWGAPTNTTNPANGTFGGGIPTRIGGATVLDRIAIGYDHGCGLTSLGAAHCWGGNEHGSLGAGDNVSSGTMRAVVDAPMFRSIHALEQASCGITSSGEVWCWGLNGYGVLGRVDPGESSSRPIRLHLDTPIKWIQGGDEYPPSTYALTESGALIAWGNGK